MWGRKIGFVVAHASMLLIVAGAIVDGIWGERGMMILKEGQTSNAFGRSDDRHSLPFSVRLTDFTVERHWAGAQIVVFRKNVRQPMGSLAVEPGGTYPLGDGDWSLRVLEVRESVERVERLVAAADEGKVGVSFTIGDGNRQTDAFVLAGGRETFTSADSSIGVLLRVFDDARERDRELAAAGREEVSANGYVEVAAGDETVRVSVVEGAEQALSGGGKVKILRYVPHFAMTDGNVTSASDKPVNPAVRIEVSRPDGKPAEGVPGDNFTM